MQLLIFGHPWKAPRAGQFLDYSRLAAGFAATCAQSPEAPSGFLYSHSDAASTSTDSLLPDPVPFFTIGPGGVLTPTYSIRMDGVGVGAQALLQRSYERHKWPDEVLHNGGGAKAEGIQNVGTPGD